MRRKQLYVAYSSRSCKSGRFLFEYLKSSELSEDFVVRRTNKKEPEKCADVVVRYGSSKTIEATSSVIEVNTREAVENASDKLKMATILFQTEGLNFPTFIPIHAMDHIPFDQGFVRDCRQNVRYFDLSAGNRILASDQYILAEIDKVNEYRVHMFEDKCIGIYEKIPIDPNSKLRKQYNSKFVRLDRSKPEVMSYISGAIPMAKLAHNAIGLTYSGVDVMRDKDGIWWVNEVNSSPGLNSLNIERVGGLMIDFINNNGHDVSNDGDN